ncbi:hypothetical protein CDAR_216521 [Caerostris darwini]|uniref:Uncharacterized protein n=1 Tax=Caerostris darwini TaxID=1538125 RepID=A0AAV4WC05_9ARAC|nr:hypothetical protein CDAR_216521 [Caerostris darwini]
MLPLVRDFSIHMHLLDEVFSNGHIMCITRSFFEYKRISLGGFLPRLDSEQNAAIAISRESDELGTVSKTFSGDKRFSLRFRFARMREISNLQRRPPWS